MCGVLKYLVFQALFTFLLTKCCALLFFFLVVKYVRVNIKCGTLFYRTSVHNLDYKVTAELVNIWVKHLAITSPCTLKTTRVVVWANEHKQKRTKSLCTTNYYLCIAPSYCTNPLTITMPRHPSFSHWYVLFGKCGWMLKWLLCKHFFIYFPGLWS